jgi:molybdenum cofactor biosynthesis enzyme MoaA
MLSTTESTGEIKSPILQELDYRPSSLCNFKCRMCTPDSSSSVYQECFGEKYVDVQKPNAITMLNQNIDTIKSIRINGGEPMILDEFWDLLNTLKTTPTKMRLCYNTNASFVKYKSHNIFDYLPHFDNVIGLSIDDIGKRAEYIRHGTSWSKVKANVDEYIKYKNDNDGGVFFSSVVSIYNALYFDEMCNMFNKMPITITICYTEWMHIGLLPKHIKDQCRERLTNLLANNKKVVNIQNVLNQLDNVPKNLLELRQLFVEKTKEHDARRNESFVETFPELACMFSDRFVTDPDY